MPSFCCSICQDTLNDASSPMTTTCGHIYCLDCATFRFSANPSCAICRKPHSLSQMIRLYPDWAHEETRKDAERERSRDEISTSPVSVRCMDKAADDVVQAVRQAIADRGKTQDALMVCNTFVNSMTDREKPHVNTELLREIAFQLALMSTKMKDDAERLTNLKAENERLAKAKKATQSARANETRLNLKIEQQRGAMERMEKANTRLTSQISKMHEQVSALQQQCQSATEEATRQRVHVAKLEGDLREMKTEVDKSEQRRLRAKKRYLELRNAVQESRRHSAGARRSHTRESSDDLLVVG